MRHLSGEDEVTFIMICLLRTDRQNKKNWIIEKDRKRLEFIIANFYPKDRKY